MRSRAGTLRPRLASTREAGRCRRSPPQKRPPSPLPPGGQNWLARTGWPELGDQHWRTGTGELGFEPRQTDPESVVLPLHHSPSSADSRSSVEAHASAESAIVAVRSRWTRCLPSRFAALALLGPCSAAVSGAADPAPRRGGASDPSDEAAPCRVCPNGACPRNASLRGAAPMWASPSGAGRAERRSGRGR